MEHYVYSATYGKVLHTVPCNSGRTLVVVKSTMFGVLPYYVDICYVEEKEQVTPETILGTRVIK